MPGRLIIIQVPDSALAQKLEGQVALRTMLAGLGDGNQVEMVRRERGKVLAAPYPLAMEIAGVFGEVAVDLSALSSMPAIPIGPGAVTASLLPFLPSAYTTLAVLPSSYYQTIKQQLGGHQVVEWTCGKVNIDLSKLRKPKKSEDVSRYAGDDYAARLQVGILRSLPYLRPTQPADSSFSENVVSLIVTQLASIKPSTPIAPNFPAFQVNSSTPALDGCIEEVRRTRAQAEAVLEEWRRKQ